MDLVTLVAACALSVQPRRVPVVTPALLHALIWEQSRGVPWSFSGPHAHQTQVHLTLRDAVRAARDERPANTFLRIGLTGLPAKSRSVSAAMFMPCQNIARATQLIEERAAHCSKRQRPGAPIDCAIAVYRGSWSAPDHSFARTVRLTAEAGDAPNVDMPSDAFLDIRDLAATTNPVASTSVALTSDPSRDDQRRSCRLQRSQQIFDDIPCIGRSAEALSACRAIARDWSPTCPSDRRRSTHSAPSRR